MEVSKSPSDSSQKPSDTSFLASLKKKWTILLPLAVLALLAIIGIGVVAYALVTEGTSSPLRVTVSNVTDQSATISWVTKDEVKGTVLVSEKDSWWPGFAHIGKARAFDDRDKESEMAGKYYVHHVTIENLEPNHKYYYRISTGLKSEAKDSEGNAFPSLESGPTLDTLRTPSPMYGKLITSDIEWASDAIVYAEVRSDSDGTEKSNLLSTVTQDKGGWQIDAANARTEDLEDVFELNNDNYVMFRADAGPDGKYVIQKKRVNTAPVGDVYMWPSTEEEEGKEAKSRMVLGVFAQDQEAPDGMEIGHTDLFMPEEDFIEVFENEHIRHKDDAGNLWWGKAWEEWGNMYGEEGWTGDYDPSQVETAIRDNQTLDDFSTYLDQIYPNLDPLVKKALENQWEESKAIEEGQTLPDYVVDEDFEPPATVEPETPPEPGDTPPPFCFQNQIDACEDREGRLQEQDGKGVCVDAKAKSDQDTHWAESIEKYPEGVPLFNYDKYQEYLASQVTGGQEVPGTVVDGEAGEPTEAETTGATTLAEYEKFAADSALQKDKYLEEGLALPWRGVSGEELPAEDRKASLEAVYQRAYTDAFDDKTKTLNVKKFEEAYKGQWHGCTGCHGSGGTRPPDEILDSAIERANADAAQEKAIETYADISGDVADAEKELADAVKKFNTEFEAWYYTLSQEEKDLADTMLKDLKVDDYFKYRYIDFTSAYDALKADYLKEKQESDWDTAFELTFFHKDNLPDIDTSNLTNAQKTLELEQLKVANALRYYSKDPSIKDAAKVFRTAEEEWFEKIDEADIEAKSAEDEFYKAMSEYMCQFHPGSCDQNDPTSLKYRNLTLRKDTSGAPTAIVFPSGEEYISLVTNEKDQRFSELKDQYENLVTAEGAYTEASEKYAALRTILHLDIYEEAIAKVDEETIPEIEELATEVRSADVALYAALAINVDLQVMETRLVNLLAPEFPKEFVTSLDIDTDLDPDKLVTSFDTFKQAEEKYTSLFATYTRNKTEENAQALFAAKDEYLDAMNTLISELESRRSSLPKEEEETETSKLDKYIDEVSLASDSFDAEFYKVYTNTVIYVGLKGANGNNSYLRILSPYALAADHEIATDEKGLAVVNQRGVFEPQVQGYEVTTPSFSVGEDDFSKIVILFDDANGNGIKDEGEETFETQGTTIKLSRIGDAETYDLKEGWNLISLPLLPFDDENKNGTWDSDEDGMKTAEDLIDEITEQGGYATHVSTYRDGKWWTYSKRAGREFANDYSLIPGQAYFVRVHIAVRLTVGGQGYDESVPLDLVTGWNLAGVISPGKDYQAVGVIDSIDGIGMDATTVTKYTSGRYESVIKEEGTVYGNDFGIERKSGYFIKVEKDGGKRWVP